MNGETENRFLEWLRISSNYQYASSLARLYSDRIYLVLKQIINKYDDAATKGKYNIDKAEAYSSYGVSAQTQVKTGSNYTFQIWIQNTNGRIGLGIFKIMVGRPAEPMYELLKDKIASIPTPGADGTILFRWPEDEKLLYASIDRILELLQGQVTAAPTSIECNNSGSIVDPMSQNARSSSPPTAAT
jgi:hypothetical protein